jgi:hypothetical protein
MEILIVGVVFVALMVYVSTKIKKSAASAFERETIDKEEFRLVKPEGFISPVDENSKFAFEAYTKEFGKNDAEEFRQAQANLTTISDSSFEAVIEKIKKVEGKVLSEDFSNNAPEAQKICLIENEKVQGDVTLTIFNKIVESKKHDKIYHLRISILDAYRETYAGKIDEMLESFVVK